MTYSAAQSCSSTLRFALSVSIEKGPASPPLFDMGGGRKRHRDRRGKPEVCVTRIDSAVAANRSRDVVAAAAAAAAFDDDDDDDKFDAHGNGASNAPNQNPNPKSTRHSSAEELRTNGRRKNRGQDTNFYDAKETKRYTAAAKNSGIQDELSWRTLHLIDVSIKPARSAFVLDIGIGAGACADVVERLTKALRPRSQALGLDHAKHSELSNKQSMSAHNDDAALQQRSGCSSESGRHQADLTPASLTAVSSPSPWTIVGIDKSQEMLEAGSSARDRVCVDFCQGLPFRRGADFDAVLSVSALQWLCLDPQDDKPIQRFMQATWDILRPDGGVLVAQFYPTVPQDTSRLLSAAQRLLCAGTAATPEKLPVQGHCEVIMDMPHRNKTKRLFLRLQKYVHTKADHHDRGVMRRERFCPCAWPHEATCALDLHLRQDSVWSESIPFLHEVATAPTAGDKVRPAAAVDKKGGDTRTRRTSTARRKSTKGNDSQHAWLQRLRDAHTRLAKTFQSGLQMLWQQQQLQAINLPRHRGGRQHLRHLKTSQEHVSHFMQRRVAPESPGATRCLLNWTSEYNRRARIEAWLCGSREKAEQKHLVRACGLWRCFELALLVVEVSARC